MEIKVKKMSIDDLYEFISKIFDDACNEIDSGYCSTCSDKTKKTEYKYKMDGKTKKELDELENSRKDARIEALENELRDRDMRLKKMHELNKNIVERDEKISNDGYALVERVEKTEKMLSDKILSDGYRILNDIQVYIEFARKCGMLKNNGFIDMINRMDNVVDGFIESQKPVC